MRLLLVAFVLAATPVLAQSLPGQQASKLVLLAGEEGAKPLAMPPPPPATAQGFVPGEDPFAPIYKRMASMQLRLMELQRVSLAGPLAVTIFGGTGLAVGVGMLLLGAASYGFFIVGLVVLGVSALPLLIGIPWLVGATSTNARISREMEKVKREQLSGNVSSRPSAVDSAVLATF